MHPGNIGALPHSDILPETASLKEPFISVATISLNAAAFIEHNLQSVAAQTYPHREHIVIDGGSTDGTVDIIRRYSPHLSYWHSRKDRGISHAFNLALAQAQGNWVLFLNTDDFLLDPSRLEAMARHLQTHRDADVVYGQRLFMKREAEPCPVRQGRGRAWSWKEFRWRQTMPHPAAFTNQRYFEQVGGFDESFHIAMDYELYLRKKGNLKAYYISLPITGMREGGRCQQSVIKTLTEAGRAQQQHQTLPTFLVRVNFFFQIGRYYLFMLAHKVLKCLI